MKETFSDVVTRVSGPAELAREYLEAAMAAKVAIRDWYDAPTPSTYKPTDGELRALNADLGFALKAAEVYATLAVADELRRIAAQPADTRSLAVTL